MVQIYAIFLWFNFAIGHCARNIVVYKRYVGPLINTTERNPSAPSLMQEVLRNRLNPRPYSQCIAQEDTVIRKLLPFQVGISYMQSSDDLSRA